MIGTFLNGFKNQVESQGISPLQAEAYAKAAERLSLAAFRGGDHRSLIPGEPRSKDTPGAWRKRIRSRA